MTNDEYDLVDVTLDIKAWFNKDPVRPEISPDFRMAEGRFVYALRSNKDGLFKAFCCFARCNKVPISISELLGFTEVGSGYFIPYTIWRYDKGCGRELLSRLLELAKESGAEGFVTLSPNTDVARGFHSSNGAALYREEKNFVNYKYF